MQAIHSKAIRSGLVQSGLAIAIAFTLGACESDSTVAADRDPGEDQALALAVMGARGDTLTAAVDNEVVVDTSLPPDLRPVTSGTPAQVAAAPPTFSPAVVQAPRPASTTAPLSSTRPPQPTTIPTPRVVAVEREAAPARARPREESKAEPPARTGLIARGSTLSVLTSRAVCNAAVGSTVRGELTSSIRGTNGLVIPEGAQVVAEVTSIDKWGAGVGVQVTSVRVGGRSYPVRTRTEYVLPQGSDSGTCVREGTRLTVETRDAISVAAPR